MNTGERIRAVRVAKGFKILDVANAVNSDVGNISRQERGKQNITETTLKNIAEFLGVKVSDLYLDQKEFEQLISKISNKDGATELNFKVKEYEEIDDNEKDEFIEIPSLDIELSAGNGHYVITEEPSFTLPFRKYFLKKMGVIAEDARVVKVSGDSMSPRLSDGDSVGVNTADKKIRDGKAYAIRQGSLLRVKLLIEQPDGSVIIRSINKDEFPDEIVPETERDVSFEIIGRVFWSASKW